MVYSCAPGYEDTERASDEGHDAVDRRPFAGFMNWWALPGETGADSDVIIL